MLRFRIPSALALIAIFSLAVWGIYKPYLFWLLPFVACLLVFAACCEMLKMIGTNGAFKAWTIAASLLVLLGGYCFFRYPNFQRVKVVLGFIALLVFTATFLIPLVTGGVKGAVQSVSASFLTLLYIPVPIAMLLGVALIGYGSPKLDGRLFLPYFVAIVKGADIGAYIVGTLFAKSPLGSHKFVPEISPKKSIEGLVGGISLSLAVGILGALYLPNVSDAMLLLGSKINADAAIGRITGAAVISLILCLLSIVGDLVESIWKRDSGIKDSGGYVPGMGGVLDVADSLLLAAPFMYAITLTLSRF
ncbi:phosphatidate cytidylyltransferase [bacterium]|nr:phosphatidate cytidylyltransferase [bacterium]